MIQFLVHVLDIRSFSRWSCVKILYLELFDNIFSNITAVALSKATVKYTYPTLHVDLLEIDQILSSTS